MGLYGLWMWMINHQVGYTSKEVSNGWLSLFSWISFTLDSCRYGSKQVLKTASQDVLILDFISYILRNPRKIEENWKTIYHSSSRIYCSISLGVATLIVSYSLICFFFCQGLHRQMSCQPTPSQPACVRDSFKLLDWISARVITAWFWLPISNSGLRLLISAS